MPRFHVPFHRRAAFRRRWRMKTAMVLVSLLLLLLLVLPAYAVYRPPQVLLRRLSDYHTDVLFDVHLTPAQKVVALTIDDAPSDETPRILSLLEANRATATFFVIGAQVRDHENVLADLVRNGNELGNHAMHDEPARSLHLTVLEQQIREVDAMIEKVYAAANSSRPASRFYRPGSGLFSNGMKALVHKLGYRLVLGSVYPHDAQISWPSINSWHILSMIRAGSIIICHDRRPWTAPMLAKVLPELKRQGYSVVSLSELLQIQGQQVTGSK